MSVEGTLFAFIPRVFDTKSMDIGMVCLQRGITLLCLSLVLCVVDKSLISSRQGKKGVVDMMCLMCGNTDEGELYELVSLDEDWGEYVEMACNDNKACINRALGSLFSPEEEEE